MIARVNTLLLTITRWTARLGMVFLLGAMLVTTADIILRKLSTAGIFGAVDIVQLMIMGAAYLSIPHGFIARRHVAVSLVVDYFGRRKTALANLLAAVLATFFMGAIAWYGYGQAVMQHEYGDVSLTLGIPKLYYWIPLLAGSALSAIVCVHMSIEAAFTALTGRGGLTPRSPS